jgi:chemotaxis protein histidine kinase CheA/CheY-like chemotaxis protein
LNERRAALVGKFRAGSLDRIGRLSLALIDVEAGRATARQSDEISRELHTLKGEATMLNFVALGEVIHAAEDRLHAAKGVDQRRREAARAILAALDTVAQWLRADLGDGDTALVAARDRLVAPPQGGPERAPAVAADPTRDATAPAAVSVAKPAEPWVQVNARRVDEVSERVSSFDAEFRALYFQLRGYARGARASTSGRGLRTLLVEFDRCQASLDEITTAAWALRLVPVEPMLIELVRHARAIAAEQGKVVRVTLQGGDAQLERSVLDVLFDPLLHLVRNALDHGIEPPRERGAKGEARLTISAEAASTNVVFVISDDGRGIDTARVRAAAVARGLLDADAAEALREQDLLDLLFVQGFSTRTQVTELSGRGVGLDIVRSSMQAVGGLVHVASELGKGTRFTLTLPVTVSKEKYLVIDGGDDRLYAIPSRHVATILRLDNRDLQAVTGGTAIRVRGATVPFRSLGDLMRCAGRANEDWVVVVESGEHLWALSVARLLGEYSLLRRPVDRVVGSVGLIAASATFEDGRLVLILSVAGLVRQSKGVLGARSVQPGAAARIVQVLVVDDSAVVRDLMTEVLTHAGFEVRVAAGGEHALALVAERMPDAILLDIDMPKMDGFEVLRRVRERSDVPIVMLTLRGSAEDQRRAATLGATAYVIKSQFQESTVLDVLRRHTAGVR